MCGIIGYSGPRAAAPILIDSLRRLEYRGYDSAGVAVLDEAHPTRTTVVRSDRKVDDLVERFGAQGAPAGHLGIGHTRWATHGRPTILNAHPHRDCTGRIHLIHNGIIENHRELRDELTAQGHEFASETDTEVVVHLIEQLYAGDLAAAVRQALLRLDGAYAFVIICADEPELLVGARLNAPLVVGLGDREVFMSSDISALIPYTKRIVLLGEGELVAARPESILVTGRDGTVVEPRIITVDWEAEQAQKGGYAHFMLKEIHEQPGALRRALRDRIDDQGRVRLDGLGVDDAVLRAIASVTVVACGSAWLAGMYAKFAIEELARVRVTVESGSEFRYANPIVDESTLVIAISQSGETADTLAAVREAKRRGATVVAITNVVGSALSLEADGVVQMHAGPEIGVAATKTFVNQLGCGLLLALRLGSARGSLDIAAERALTTQLAAVPGLIERTLLLEPRCEALAHRFAGMRSALYMGRGANVAIAFEGAMKLKEISYVHAEGYAAGELKHGPIALLDSDFPVIAIATRSRTLAKTVSNVEEVRARDAPIIALVSEGENPFDPAMVAEVIDMPGCEELFSPLVNVVALQLFAYHVAVAGSKNVDQPRNLAKSVVVE